ncbi:tetratricopeptide repeat protein [Streptomyces olivaceus]|uniref:tetratricopeptide repeat protein n=2 Tax=Streptomyces olivaceus TaxID=47716 RepID=UPI001884964A|nr:tetratricopeptide repeat protein [Streptomyces olivaceus]
MGLEVVMPERLRGGRPWGPIRADSAEARQLAEFLREQVDFSGRTLAQLAEQIHVSKSQISVGLAGKVPEPAFVTALIHATIPEPRLRKQRLDRARELLEAAAHPSPANPGPPAASEVELAGLRAQQVETYDRLTHSLEAQNRLHEAAGNSAKLVMVLLSMINRLERRITDLTGERDQLRAAHVDPDALHHTQQQLARAHEQEQRAQWELSRAQEKQRQAEALAATVQAQITQLTDELDRLRTTTGADATENTPAPATTPASTTTDPVGDDFDQALTRITAVNDHGDQLLHGISADLHQEPGEDHDAEFWWVVQNNPPDNPLASPDTTDNLKAKQEAAEAAGTAGDYRRAVKLYTDLVTAYTHRNGPEHPDTLITRNNLAHWQGEAGDPAGARDALTGLLPAMARVLGPEHPHTLTTGHYLARWRGEAGDPAGAHAALTGLLPDMVRVLGPEHPDTLTARNNLADWHGRTGDPAGAYTAFTRFLPDMVRVLGPEHPDTLTTRNNLAHWQGEAGDPAGAHAALTRLLPDMVRVLGPEHPDTLTTRNNLAHWKKQARGASRVRPRAPLPHAAGIPPMPVSAPLTQGAPLQAPED